MLSARTKDENSLLKVLRLGGISIPSVHANDKKKVRAIVKTGFRRNRSVACFRAILLLFGNNPNQPSTHAENKLGMTSGSPNVPEVNVRQ